VTGTVERRRPIIGSGIPDGFRSSMPSRKVYFGPRYGLVETQVIARKDLANVPTPGPLLIDEYDSTTVIPPLCKAWLDGHGNIRASIEGNAQ